VDVKGGEPTGRRGRWTLNPWRWRKSFLWNYQSHLPSNAASQYRRPESSITLL